MAPIIPCSMVLFQILTLTRHSAKVLVVRALIIFLVLVFSIQSWTKADDIRDFEIEGMSIGDSLLKFYNNDKVYNILLND